MNIQQVLELDISNLNVLIIGTPASGKTWLSNKLSKEHRVIHTDDYMKYGFKDSLYKLIEDLRNISTPVIVEGVQGYRLLRKGVELDCYYPNMVIELYTTPERVKQTYLRERDPKKLRYLEQFGNTMGRILQDYRAMPNKRKPEWYKVMNDY
jgi:adenylate kinase family enzyme